MIGTALGIVAIELQNIDVPYEFMRWTSAGEFTETTTATEDGYEESTLLLTGTTRDSWASLMQDRDKIKDHFPNIGARFSTENGAVVIFYENAFPVPTGEADLKRIQINLRIKTWKGID